MRASGARLRSSRHRKTTHIRRPRRNKVHPAVDGAAPGPRPTSPDPTDSCRGEGGGAAPVGSRRDFTLATTEAVGGGVACPGGDKSSQSDWTSSGHVVDAAKIDKRRQRWDGPFT